MTALPRLQRTIPLVDTSLTPSQPFHIWWDQFAKNLESALASIADQVTVLAGLVSDIAAAQATADTAIADAAAAASDAADAAAQALDAANDALTAISDAAAAQSAANTAQSTANTAQSSANTAQSTANTAQSTANTAQSTANTANTAANTAQSTADVVNRNDSISTSWTSPGAILTASDAGASATITIAAHTRKYTDITSKSVNGGSLTGLAYSTVYYVYYDQTGRTGGTVTYHSTTDPNVGLANAVAGRHACGAITTPAAGAADTSGGVAPPGGGGDFNYRFDDIP
jgi:hypothetical protein